MKPAVDFDNRAEVADWFASLMERSLDLVEIATAATAPKSERVMSRAALRRELEATYAELRQLCRAGRRGIRTPSTRIQ